MPSRTILYHEISEIQSRYGYEISRSRLRAQLSLVRRAASLTHITFDDGHISNLLGAEILDELGIKATFFVTAKWVATANHLGWNELKELVDRGHRVQSHAVSHRWLTHLSVSEARSELADSKRVIEDRIGSAVADLAAPGGRWNRKVAHLASEAGYRTLYTTDPWRNSLQIHEVRVAGRLNIDDATQDEFLAQYLRGQDLMLLARGKFLLKRTLQKILGDERYHRAWEILQRAP